MFKYVSLFLPVNILMVFECFGLKIGNGLDVVVKEREIEIGYPTDVKHVAHIGLDGQSSSAPSWVSSPHLLFFIFIFQL